jgi:hypothetical protein
MVGGLSAFDPVDEENNDKDAQANIAAQKKIQATVTPQQAAKVSELYKQNGWVSPRVLLDMAKQSGLSQQAVDAVAKIEATKLATQNDPNKADPKGWFDRNIYSKVKSATRWGFAALQLTPDLTQNVASQIFSPNDPTGTAGVFASTQLGTMLSGQDSGEGFFFGGKAAETQAQRAKDFRGTINNHAWTIGRGAANLVFTPGTKEYSLLSGFFDAAVTIYADPTIVAGQAFKAAKTGQQVKGLIGTRAVSQKVADQLVARGIIETDKIPSLTREGADAAARISRGEIGLDSAEAISFRESEYFAWFDRNSKAVRLSQRLADHASTATKNIADRGLDTTEAAIERGKAAYKIMSDFRGKIDPETAKRLAEADSPLKIKAIIGEAAARLSANPEDVLIPKQIGAIKGTGATFAARELARERIPVYRTLRNSRWFTEIPTEKAIIYGSGLDKTKSVETYANYLRGIRIHTEATEIFDNFMGEAMNVFGETNVAIRKEAGDQLYAKFLEIVTKYAGGDERIAQEVKRIHDAELARIRAFGADELGQLDDGGTLQMLRQFGIDDKELKRFSPDDLNQLRIQGPTALVELAENVHILPDFRKLRALTSNPFLKKALKTDKILRNKKGEQRTLLAVAEELQQEVWKPMILATGGYVVRNMIDSHIRMAAKGYQNFFTHPFQFIQTVMGSRFVGPLTGGEGKALTFEGALTDDVSGGLSKILKDYQEVANRSVYQHLQDPLTANERAIRGENFSFISRGSDPTAHTTGYIDNLGQLRQDPILRKLAQLSTLPTQERQAAMSAWLQTTDEGKEAAKTVVEYFRNGVRIADQQTGQPQFIKITSVSDTDLITTWLDRASQAKLNTVIRNDEELRFIVAHGRVPKIESLLDERGLPTSRLTEDADGLPTADVQFVPREEIPVDNLVMAERGQNKTVGALVKLDSGDEAIITRIIPSRVEDPFNPGTLISRDIAEVQAVAPGQAFTSQAQDPGLFGSNELREVIDLKGNQRKLAPSVKVANRVMPGKSPKLDNITKAMDTGVKWFFNSLVGKATQKLERSPLYRQAFYRTVADNANLLSPAEQQTLQANIAKYVKSLNDDLIQDGKRGNMSVEKYVGNKEIYNKIFGQTATGDGTVAQLEQFAGAMARQELQETLYNAQKKGNLEDMLRVVAPFATAFRETLGQYTSYLVEDPSRIRKTQLAFNAANYDSDNPDNALSGWFAKDPINGTNVFNFPIGGWAGAMLQFPIRGAFQVLNLPGAGPVLQIAASNVLPDAPQLEFVRKMILPYGEKGPGSLAPQWATRGIEAIRGDTANLGTIYANTYAEVVRHKIQSGSYNTKDPNDMAKLYADARRKAQVLAGMRALFQFTGPTSPQIDFRLETDGGDIIASSLSQEFYKMKLKNPDTVVSDFIDKFGEDAFIYMGHKTEPTTSGIEPTKVFSDWAKDNDDLMAQYKGIAGYFAPGGDSFSFEAFNRQIQKGERRRLTAEETVAAAQYKIASSIYREKRNQMGDTLNQEQRDWLAQWRTFLNKEYPGFPIKADFNPGEFPNFINNLRTAVTDNRLADNDVANAVKQYLDARDQALENAAAAGFSSFQSPKTQPLKDWLASIAAALVQQTPEFARIYEDKLAAEVD